MKPVTFEDLGRTRYEPAWEHQRAVHAEVAAGTRGDHLIFCEHEPVITMGKSGKGHNLLVAPSELARRGVDYFEVERGGDLTYHGPGQLVGYPIFKLARLRDVQAFVRKMEAALIDTLAQFGIEGEQRTDHAGVFVGGAKIVSIGAAVREGVTFHGFALDVCTDLSYFRLINPCGMPEIETTTIARRLGRDVTLGEVKPAALAALERAYDVVITSSVDASLSA